MAESVTNDPCIEAWNTPSKEAKRVGVTTRTLARWRASRKGPPWFKVCDQIRYNPRLTDDHLLKSRRDPVAESDA